MLNPVWLNTFATVAASHSFTDAGRQLSLTQSSVSEHIRRLGEHVGRRLLVRDTHSLALTADGEAMLVHARVILEAMSHAESQFRSPRLRGRVRLGSSDDMALGPLPSVLAAFRSTHPDVELEITIGMTGRLYERLDAGAIDLLIGKRRLGDRRGILLFSGKLEWLPRRGAERAGPDGTIEFSRGQGTGAAVQSCRVAGIAGGRIHRTGGEAFEPARR